MESRVLPKAISGDYYALCDLLLVVSETIRHGDKLTPGLSTFLVDALRKMADGENPGTAFHIHRRKGQRDTRESIFKNIGLAGDVALARKEWEEGTKKMLRGDDPIAQVSSSRKVPYETVKAAWRDYRHCVELPETGAAAYLFNAEKRVKRRRSRRKRARLSE